MFMNMSRTCEIDLRTFTTLCGKNLQIATERQKRDYDSRIVENVYQKGDIVYKREGAGKKLDPKYTGPFIVIECLSPSVYKI